MTFARRSLSLFPFSMSSSRRGRRPSRARRPSLGPERCEERLLLSAALVSANAAGSAAGNGDSDFNGVSPDESALPAPPQSPQGNLGAGGTRLVFASDATGLLGSIGVTNGDSNVYVRDLTTGRPSLVSATPGGQPGNGDSDDPVISPDGRYVAFLSQATNLSTVDASSGDLTGSSTTYLYLRDLETGTTTLLDQTPYGQTSDGGSAGVFVFSPDSQSLAFIDTSDDLTTATVDPNSGPGSPFIPGWGPSTQPQYAYVRDLAAQTTSLVSVSMAGAASALNSLNSGDTTSQLVFSPDSQSLVFASDATDLTANAPGSPSNPDVDLPNATMNLFLRDLKTGTTTLLTPTTGGGLSEGGGGSMGPILSPDGQSVAFLSGATGLTANPAGPDGPGLNLYIRNLTTGTTTLVSATPDGQLSSGEVSSPAFGLNGGSLAYISTATDLTKNATDPNRPPDNTMVTPSMPSQSILADMSNYPATVGPLPITSVTTPATTIATVGGPPATSMTSTTSDPATGPWMPTIGEGPQFGGQNVFLTDLSTGTTTLISATPGGQVSSGWADGLAFSPDGRYLAFTSDAGDLTSNAFESKPPTVPGVPPRILAAAMTSIDNVFVHDLHTGQTSLASATTGGLLSDGTSDGLIFSPDSQSLFFTSTALDLTSNPPDTSNGPLATYGSPPDNLFVRDLTTGTTSLVSATTGGLLSGTSYTSAVLSPDGRSVYFDSDAADLATGDPGGSMNIFAASAPFTPSKVQTTPPSMVPTSPVSTTNNPPSTASSTATPSKTSPTPTPTPTAPTPAPVADPGPTVSSVAVVKGRRGITELAITFDRALDPATAQNTANYQVSLPGRTVRVAGGHRTAVRPGRWIAVTAATYDAASHQVTLTLRAKLNPQKTTQLEINGASGGVASTDGVPLNSPNSTRPGQDYLGTVDLAARHA